MISLFEEFSVYVKKFFYRILLLKKKDDVRIQPIWYLRTGSFKLFKRPFPGFLTILTL